MSAVALSKTSLSATPVRARAGASVPEKGVFARIFDAFVASRKAQAEREVSRYLALRDPNYRY